VTQNLAHILEEVEQLSVVERDELASRLVETLVRDSAPDIQRAQLSEVRGRIAEVESGAVNLIPGDEAIAEVRRVIEAVSKAG
jgi:hypothetical protein